MAQHALLTTEDHRDLRVSTDRGAELGDAVMCSIVVPTEFRSVQDEYPILFRLNAERDRFTALAMFGFDTGENLFLDGGTWDARYLPLAIDIQPFLIGGSPADSGDKQVHIDLDSPRIGADGVRLFDEDGRPTPYLESITDKLGALDAGYQASADFFAALERHKLLEPLTLEITLDDGSTNRLVGFHGIDEDRLRELDPTTLGELHADDHLMPIFMALASIGRLRELIARKNRRVGHG
jgi:hypothetical protein